MPCWQERIQSVSFVSTTASTQVDVELANEDKKLFIQEFSEANIGDHVFEITLYHLDYAFVTPITFQITIKVESPPVEETQQVFNFS